MVGKKNMVFGFVYFLATLAVGMYLANELSLGDAEFAASETRSAIRTAHAHANMESVLNIVIGYLLCRLALAAWLAKTVSVLLIIGALTHSGALLLGSFGMEAALMLAPVGALSLVAVMALMGFGVLKTEQIG
jgi:hypothetical protein